jgi:hypothetical protein
VPVTLSDVEWQHLSDSIDGAGEAAERILAALREAHEAAGYTFLTEASQTVFADTCSHNLRYETAELVSLHAHLAHLIPMCLCVHILSCCPPALPTTGSVLISHCAFHG